MMQCIIAEIGCDVLELPDVKTEDIIEEVSCYIDDFVCVHMFPRSEKA